MLYLLQSNLLPQVLRHFYTKNVVQYSVGYPSSDLGPKFCSLCILFLAVLLILDLWDISFHAVVVFGLGKNLLFKSILGRCDLVTVFPLSHLAEANFLESLDHEHTNCINLWSPTRDSNENGIPWDCTCRRTIFLLVGVCTLASALFISTRILKSLV